jgi:hypothetical protein
LEGVCSECGLGLEYRNILNRRLLLGSRFIEAAEGRLGRAWRITVWRALSPRGFWGWVRMEYPVRAGRLVGGVGLGALFLYVMGALAWGVLLVGLEMLRVWGAGRPAWYSPSFHISERAKTVLLVNQDGFWPWDDPHFGGSMGTHVIAGGLALLLTPLCFVCLPQTLRAARVRRRHLVRITAWSVLGAVVILQGVSCGLRLIAAAENFLWFAQDSYLWNFTRKHEGRVFMLALVAWLAAWWFFACRDYLRLPHGRAVAFLMVLMAVLLAVLMTLFVPGAYIPLLT